MTKQRFLSSFYFCSTAAHSQHPDTSGIKKEVKLFLGRTGKYWRSRHVLIKPGKWSNRFQEGSESSMKNQTERQAVNDKLLLLRKKVIMKPGWICHDWCVYMCGWVGVCVFPSLRCSHDAGYTCKKKNRKRKQKEALTSLPVTNQHQNTQQTHCKIWDMTIHPYVWLFLYQDPNQERILENDHHKSFDLKVTNL